MPTFTYEDYKPFEPSPYDPNYQVPFSTETVMGDVSKYWPQFAPPTSPLLPQLEAKTQQILSMIEPAKAASLQKAKMARTVSAQLSQLLPRLGGRGSPAAQAAASNVMQQGALAGETAAQQARTAATQELGIAGQLAQSIIAAQNVPAQMKLALLGSLGNIGQTAAGLDLSRWQTLQQMAMQDKELAQRGELAELQYQLQAMQNLAQSPFLQYFHPGTEPRQYMGARNEWIEALFEMAGLNTADIRHKLGFGFKEPEGLALLSTYTGWRPGAWPGT